VIGHEHVPALQARPEQQSSNVVQGEPLEPHALQAPPVSHRVEQQSVAVRQVCPSGRQASAWQTPARQWVEQQGATTVPALQ
jgi:hypothetical protein